MTLVCIYGARSEGILHLSGFLWWSYKQCKINAVLKENVIKTLFIGEQERHRKCVHLYAYTLNIYEYIHIYSCFFKKAEFQNQLWFYQSKTKLDPVLVCPSFCSASRFILVKVNIFTL